MRAPSATSWEGQQGGTHQDESRDEGSSCLACLRKKFAGVLLVEGPVHLRARHGTFRFKPSDASRTCAHTNIHTRMMRNVTHPLIKFRSLEDGEAADVASHLGALLFLLRHTIQLDDAFDAQIVENRIDLLESRVPRASAHGTRGKIAGEDVEEKSKGVETGRSRHAPACVTYRSHRPLADAARALTRAPV